MVASPTVRMSQSYSRYFPNLVSLMRDRDSCVTRVTRRMASDSSTAWEVNQKDVYYYLVHLDDFSGYYLLAGFHIPTRTHIAAGRSSLNVLHHRVTREAKEVREFLEDMRGFLKNWSPRVVNTFLREYTHVNPVAWDDALALVTGDMTLKEKSYQCMSRLPLSYLKCCAPHTLYRVFHLSSHMVRMHNTITE